MLAGRGDEIPARAMLAVSDKVLRPRAESLARAIAALHGCTASVESGESQPGSGSAPGVFLPTFVVRITHANHSAAKLAQLLRNGDPPVFTRVQDAAVLLDPRTLLDGDAERLVEALRRIAG
jgi:L-seryl-tRNA(Ser) seleniumtransferase